MDYKNNLEQYLEDFHRYDKDGKMFCAQLGTIDFTAIDLKKMIDMEMKGRASLGVLIKLHARFTKLRSQYERELIRNLRADWDTRLLKKKTKEGAQELEKGLNQYRYQIAS